MCVCVCVLSLVCYDSFAACQVFMAFKCVWWKRLPPRPLSFSSLREIKAALKLEVDNPHLEVRSPLGFPAK